MSVQIGGGAGNTAIIGTRELGGSTPWLSSR